MASTKYGAVNTAVNPLRWQVANTAAITEGDMLCWDGAGQYVTPCGAGDIPCAVALESVVIQDDDGDVTCLVETSPEAFFRYPTDDASSISNALVGKTCDVAGAQSIDIGSSTDDCIKIMGFNTTNSTVLVKIDFDKAFAGVV